MFIIRAHWIAKWSMKLVLLTKNQTKLRPPISKTFVGWPVYVSGTDLKITHSLSTNMFFLDPWVRSLHMLLYRDFFHTPELTGGFKRGFEIETQLRTQIID